MGFILKIYESKFATFNHCHSNGKKSANIKENNEKQDQRQIKIASVQTELFITKSEQSYS